MVPRVLPTLCCLVSLAAQEPRPLRGQVVDEQGRPLAGVAVCPFADGERWTTAELVKAAAVRTDPQGRFALAEGSVPPERDCLLFVAPGRMSMVAARTWLDFAPIVLPPGAVLAGRVVDAEGAPIAGARVEAGDWLREVCFRDQETAGTGRPVPTPFAAASTDARGAFVLSGACASAAWLQAEGDGRRQASLGPVSAQDPLTIVLERAPLLRGRVVDPEHGAVGDLTVHIEATEQRERQQVRTDAEGAFGFTWPGGPVRLSVTVRRGEQRWTASTRAEDPGAEPVLNLRLLPPRPAARAPRAAKATRMQPERIVKVRAVGPDGRPLAAFRAAVHRIDRGQHQYRTEAPQLREFESAAVAADDGVAAAPVHEGQGQDGLLVLVKAEGLALACRQFDAGEQTVEVKLEPAGAIAGQVVDAKTGAPLAGARVWSLAPSEHLRVGRLGFQPLADFDPGLGAVTTDAQGSFRLEQMPSGARHVCCVLPGHAERPPELVELAAGAERLDLRIELAPLLDLDGRLSGSVPLRTQGVRLKKHTPGSWTSAEAADYSSTFAVDEQGRFRATGIAPGKYEVQLVRLRPPRQGLPEKLPLEIVDVGLDGKPLQFDSSVAQPARLTGRVTGPVPAGRLAVLSCAAPTGNHFYGYLNYEGPITPLGPDGSFALEEPPGPRIVIVIDVATGAMLHRAEQVQVAPGGERKVELAVDAVAVTFRVTGAGSGWHWLEIVPSPEQWPAGVGLIAKGVDHGYFLRMGARLEPDRHEGVLWLPNAPCRLRLRAAGGRTQLPRDKDVLAEVAIDPADPRERNVTIAVAPK